LQAASVRVSTNTIRVVNTVVREDTNHGETNVPNTFGENTNNGENRYNPACFFKQNPPNHKTPKSAIPALLIVKLIFKYIYFLDTFKHSNIARLITNC